MPPRTVQNTAHSGALDETTPMQARSGAAVGSCGLHAPRHRRSELNVRLNVAHRKRDDGRDACGLQPNVVATRRSTSRLRPVDGVGDGGRGSACMLESAGSRWPSSRRRRTPTPFCRRGDILCGCVKELFILIK